MCFVLNLVVTIDVIRAFTTAAYAFAAGAREIFLVGTVEQALTFKARNTGVLAMGEEGGHRPSGFDFSNSPVAVSGAKLNGRTLVQRTSAGTQGVLAARGATRSWCASLVCASATARAVRNSGLGVPSYVITGRFFEPDGTLAEGGEEDLVAAHYIEHVRQGLHVEQADAISRVRNCSAARRT